MTPIAGVACAMGNGFPATAEALRIEAIPTPNPIKARMHTAMTVRKILVALSRMVISPFTCATPAIQNVRPFDRDALADAVALYLTWRVA